MDSKSAFYRGGNIAGSDVATFELIFILGENGNKLFWYAKDKSNYYDGKSVMSKEEIIELEKMRKKLTY